MMSATQDLLARIEAFSIDGDESVALPFAARLARERGWTRAYADRVVREYKRFVALAVTGGKPVCPSEEVDAAWHLHLTYTRSYWKRFCGEILGQPLHHDPTRGGLAEVEKHQRMYEETLVAYRQNFGEAPPRDIWPPVEKRFGPAARSVVVNTSQNWVVPKSWVRRGITGSAVAAAILVFATGCVGGLINPFDLVGTQFLYFLIPVMIASVAVGRLWRSAVQYPGPQPGDENLKFDWEQLAYMAGGADRLTTAAIARMISAGTIRVSEDGKLLEPAGPTPAVMTPTEAVIWNKLPTGRSRTILVNLTQKVSQGFAEEASRLRDEGFMLTGGRKLGVYLTALAPLALVVLMFGLPRMIMGLAHGKPVGYLVITLALGGFLGAMVAIAGNIRATRRGEGLLENHQSQNAHFRKGQGLETADAAALGVALFGTAVLVDPMYAAINTWFPRPSSPDSGCSTSCGSSDGGGGGDGGGCGSGCGGCGGGD